MNKPAPGASRNAVGTAPLQSDFNPPDLYRVEIEVKVEGFLAVVEFEDSEEEGRDSVD